MFSIMSREELHRALQAIGAKGLTVDTSVLDVTSPCEGCIYLDVLQDVRNQNYRFEDFIAACEQILSDGRPCEFERIRGFAFAVFAEQHIGA